MEGTRPLTGPALPNLLMGTYPFNSAKILPLCNKTVEKSLLTGRNLLCCIRCYKFMSILWS